jgi:hypothetical protein
MVENWISMFSKKKLLRKFSKNENFELFFGIFWVFPSNAVLFLHPKVPRKEYRYPLKFYYTNNSKPIIWWKVINRNKAWCGTWTHDRWIINIEIFVISNKCNFSIKLQKLYLMSRHVACVYDESTFAVLWKCRLKKFHKAKILSALKPQK